MRVIFDHVRPSGRIMPVMQVIEAQSARSWGLTITSITNRSAHSIWFGATHIYAANFAMLAAGTVARTSGDCHLVARVDADTGAPDAGEAAECVPPLGGCSGCRSAVGLVVRSTRLEPGSGGPTQRPALRSGRRSTSRSRCDRRDSQ